MTKKKLTKQKARKNRKTHLDNLVEAATSAKLFFETPTPLRVGNQVFIRAVTNYYTGRIVEITEGEILLVDAAWIADTGRFSDALKTGNLNEVEPYPNLVAVGRGAIVDVTHWPHELPRVQK
jgi:hypothetical protein